MVNTAVWTKPPEPAPVQVGVLRIYDDPTIKYDDLVYYDSIIFVGATIWTKP